MAYYSKRFGKMKNGAMLQDPTTTTKSAPGADGALDTPTPQQIEDANERAGFIPRVTQNTQDRWTNNPGETFGEIMLYRNADRAEDLFQNVADRATKRADTFDALGMTNMADLARQRTAGATTKATGFSTLTPDAAKDKFKTGLNETVDDLTRGGYLPYEGDVTNWQDYIKNFDPNVDPALKANVVNWNPGNESAVGTPYRATEQDMLSGLEDLGSTSSMLQSADEYNQFAKKVGEGLGTDLENAIENQSLAAVQGKLTDSDSQWYKNQSALLDQQQADEIKALRQQMGATGGLASGKFQAKLAEITNKYKTQKQAVLSDLQKSAATNAQTYALQSRQNTTNYLNTINNMVQTQQTTKADALKTTGTYLTNTAQIDVQKMAQKLQEKQTNVETALKEKQLELERTGQAGDAAKWKNEYDIAQRTNYRELLNDIFDVSKLFSTGGSIINTAIGALAS